jgi:hypothetical protein
MSNIPQTYTDLLLVYSARSDRAAFEDTTNIRFNGDSGANYSFRMVYQYNSTIGNENGASQTGMKHTSTLTAASATANTFGSAEVHIPNYTGSAAKSVLSTGVAENNGTQAIVGMNANLWNSTAAVTSITLIPWFGTNFVAGSTFYLYAITQVPVIVGGVETISGGYKVHTFTSTSSLRVIEGGVVEYLVVGGGGSGGGQYEGGGGGAGGLLQGRLGLGPGNQTVTVGGGGAAAAGGTDGGSNGTDSSVFSLTAVGGGRGGRFSNVVGAAGGSGGGGGGSGAAGGAGTSGQGSAGGTGASQAGGGGGGAVAAGGSASTNTGGNGGAGVFWVSSHYAGGGGGGATTTPGSGGVGGGGSGANYTVGAVAGRANTGGGGGGIREGVGVTAGAGGSGIVIIRYPHIGN